jgi:thiol-disulfide isomerase/thioredoxin
MIALSDFAGARALLVMFICNHCPFVKHIAHGLVDLGNVYQSKGVAVVAINSNDVEKHPDDRINSNDVEKHPDDRPLMMAEEVVSRGYTFPYLFDETQETAKAYRAACTPDFFVYDQDRKLVYRGQLDDSRPSNDMPVTGADLRAALDAVIEGRPVNEDQKPSIGCNIKWKPGNEPDYFSS